MAYLTERPAGREPDFANLAAVLEKKRPSRPTLYEFFMNDRLYRNLVGDGFRRSDPIAIMPDYETVVFSFLKAGYDYATVTAAKLYIVPFHVTDSHAKTITLNAGHYIYDRATFDSYEWPDPWSVSMDDFSAIAGYLPAGMKVIPFGPGGVLENVIGLTGYENLCMMLYDDEQLVYDLFEKVGSIIVDVYSRVLDYPFVGAVMSNDDWGFNTQTFLSTEDMRRFVFPWHKKIVEKAHSAGVYTMLHSCGNYSAIIDDIAYDMKYDARHSYEDKIVPVESAYESLKGKIAVLGGLDVNFMVKGPAEAIYDRATAMLERTMEGGGYALGTGNSVPDYIPDEHYFAMINAAFDFERKYL